MSDPSRNQARLATLAAVGVAGVALVASLAFVLLQIGAPADRFAACRKVQVAGGIKLGGAFTLTDETGARVTDTQVLDRPALVYFGYTFCPDVCPVDTVRNADAADLLAESGHQVRPVMITVDPGRDTPQVLADYTDLLHPDMIGLTGSDADLATVRAAYGAVASRADDDPDYYLVSHSTLTYLTLPGEGVVAMYPRNVEAADLAAEAACFLELA